MTDVFFLTSNRAKLMHARHLAREYDIEVRGRRQYGKAYNEPRLQDREVLLKESYKDAANRWAKDSGDRSSFFFFEDTSVIIEALSESEEVPGPDVKYWMKDMTFDLLDAELRRLGSNRNVLVRSDVVLHVPTRFKVLLGIERDYIVFTAESRGTIVKSERPIQTNLLYPWLDDRTFNKWFVPEGTRLPLSAMSIDDADKHDFRARSVGSMLEYLCTHGFIARKVPKRASDVQTLLPSFVPPVLLVSGLPCAGKTTLGEHLSEHYGYFHIEASDFMKRAFYERHGLNSSLSIHDFAEDALLNTPEVVVTPVIKELERSRAIAVVITGFRSPVEIEIFLREFRGDSIVLSSYVECSEEERFRRSGKRARKDAATSAKQFRERDALQLKMGLKRIRTTASDLILENNTTKRAFFRAAVDALRMSRYRDWKPQPLTAPECRPKGLEDAILIAMALRDKLAPSSTTEIAHLVNSTFLNGMLRTNKNNVSRYFNFRHSAYYSVDTGTGVARYTLSATGKSKAMQLLGRVRGG